MEQCDKLGKLQCTIARTYLAINQLNAGTAALSSILGGRQEYWPQPKAYLAIELIKQELDQHIT